MKLVPFAAALAASLGFALATPAMAVQPIKAPKAAAPPSRTVVEPEALQALNRMGAYLRTLNAFELTSDTTLDLVMDNGQLVQVGGTARYKVRRPNSFVIDVDSDLKKRRFIYDGHQFTVVAPQFGYYASVPAPATIRATLDTVWTKFGIALPLEDLFRWSESGAPATGAKLQSGFGVGRATLDGQPVDQYVFREGDVDWQIWIQTGAQPLPRKVVIIDRSDPSHPAYTAKLSWNVSPTLSDADFAFQPDAKAKRISLAANSR